MENEKGMAVCVISVLSGTFDCFIWRSNVVVKIERCYNIDEAGNGYGRQIVYNRSYNISIK